MLKILCQRPSCWRGWSGKRQRLMGKEIKQQEKECRRSWRERSRGHTYRKDVEGDECVGAKEKEKQVQQINGNKVEGKGCRRRDWHQTNRERWKERKRKEETGKREFNRESMRKQTGWWVIRIAAMSASRHVSSKKKKEETPPLPQQCHVLLHHWIGLEDSGPTSDEGSHMPLGCFPFWRAQLASTHPCNYLYSICVLGIVQSNGSTP